MENNKKCEAETKMAENCEKCGVKTKMADQNGEISLLMLNEYCLMNILEFLDLSDFVNLDKTCTVLRDIGARVCALKFKGIEVEFVVKDYVGEYMTKQDFCNVLSVIGKSISSVKMLYANQCNLDIIRENCINLESLDLSYSSKKRGKLQVQDFRNLTELKLFGEIINTNDLENCFANNPDIEKLVCQFEEDLKLLQLLEMLPKLEHLELKDMHCRSYLNPQLQHLLRLDQLTKFTYQSWDQCNQLLAELAKKSNLVQLNIHMDLNVDTFDILKEFRNLKSLSITTNSSLHVSIPETTVFPPKLESIIFTGFIITCSNFFSIVKQLKFLQQLNYQVYGDRLGNCKFLNQNCMLLDHLTFIIIFSAIRFFDSEEISRIVDELKVELAHRKLRIICNYKNMEDKPQVSNY